MKTRLKLTKEERDMLSSAIKQYFLEERDEEIGDLSSTLILDFFIAKLAPTFYNRGVNDAKAMLTEKLEDLHGLELWQ